MPYLALALGGRGHRGRVEETFGLIVFGCTAYYRQYDMAERESIAVSSEAARRLHGVGRQPPAFVRRTQQWAVLL